MNNQEYLNKEYAKRELAQKRYEEELEGYIQARQDYAKALDMYSSDTPPAS